MVDRTKVCAEVLATIETLVGKERIWGTLPRTVKVKQAILYRQPLHRLAKGSPLGDALQSLADIFRREVAR